MNKQILKLISKLKFIGKNEDNEDIIYNQVSGEVFKKVDNKILKEVNDQVRNQVDFAVNDNRYPPSFITIKSGLFNVNSGNKESNII